MNIREEVVNGDEMNLYDFVMMNYERFFDLTESRQSALEFYLSNCRARYINVAEFKAVFDVETFNDILRTITDFKRFDELNNYGIMSYQGWIQSKNKEISYGSVLEKVY